MKLSQWVSILTAGMMLAACSSQPSRTANPQDPWEGFNRSMFAFNEGLSSALKPLGNGGKERGMHHPLSLASNVFSNIGDAPNAVNDVLQGKPRQAVNDGLRFAFNSTFGLAGLLDVASEMGIPKNDEDFGQTLGKWGVASGPYVVLPFWGPSTARDVVAMPVDSALDPLTYVKHDRGWKAARLLTKADEAAKAEALLESPTGDKYSVMREAWLQYRANQVRDGELDTASKNAMINELEALEK